VPGNQTPLSWDKASDYDTLSNQTLFSMNSIGQKASLTSVGSTDAALRQDNWLPQDNAQNKKEFSSPNKDVRTYFCVLVVCDCGKSGDFV
jgi:hypothetical protein